ncbi:MAG: hypothetical protein K8T25_14360 [Planctomycetia bacterium]|nr:hypothetical protein [Planctomycetia bacterium]
MNLRRQTTHIAHHSTRAPRLALLAAAALLGLSGCEYLGIGKTTPPTKTGGGGGTAPSIIKKLTTPEPPARLMELSLTPAVKLGDCHITLKPAAGQVPPMLYISSYADPQSESFPSVYIRAVAPSGQLRELVDKSLPAKIYIAYSATGLVWETPEGQPGQVMIKAADDTHAVGTIADSTFVNLATGQKVNASGRFDGKAE